jgi:hypothetical protein
MFAEARKRQGERIKAYWAAKRAAKVDGAKSRYRGQYCEPGWRAFEQTRWEGCAEAGPQEVGILFLCPYVGFTFSGIITPPWPLCYTHRAHLQEVIHA